LSGRGCRIILWIYFVDNWGRSFGECFEGIYSIAILGEGVIGNIL